MVHIYHFIIESARRLAFISTTVITSCPADLYLFVHPCCVVSIFPY